MAAITWASPSGRWNTRVAEHNAGALGGYMARRRPVELVWCQDFKHMDETIETERQIQRWRRVKKEALIATTGPACRPWPNGGAVWWVLKPETCRPSH